MIINKTTSLFIVVLFCIDFFLIYRKTVNSNKKITEKQKAYILSIKASLTIFLLSLYFNYKFYLTNFNKDNYTLSLTNDDKCILHFGALQLISYFIMDISIGFLNYHKNMCNLAGYFHHIVYIFVSIYALKHDYTSYYLLYMIEELPTFFLSSGGYNKKLRFDNLFGLTFFSTRILYHIYLTWFVKSNPLFLLLGCLSLVLHSFWFKNWYQKYFTLSFLKKKALLPKNNNNNFQKKLKKD